MKDGLEASSTNSLDHQSVQGPIDINNDKSENTQEFSNQLYLEDSSMRGVGVNLPINKENDILIKTYHSYTEKNIEHTQFGYKEKEQFVEDNSINKNDIQDKHCTNSQEAANIRKSDNIVAMPMPQDNTFSNNNLNSSVTNTNKLQSTNTIVNKNKSRNSLENSDNKDVTNAGINKSKKKNSDKDIGNNKGFINNLNIDNNEAEDNQDKEITKIKKTVISASKKRKPSAVESNFFKKEDYKFEEKNSVKPKGMQAYEELGYNTDKSELRYSFETDEVLKELNKELELENNMKKRSRGKTPKAISGQMQLQLEQLNQGSPNNKISEVEENLLEVNDTQITPNSKNQEKDNIEAQGALLNFNNAGVNKGGCQDRTKTLSKKYDSSRGAKSRSDKKTLGGQSGSGDQIFGKSNKQNDYLRTAPGKNIDQNRSGSINSELKHKQSENYFTNSFQYQQPNLQATASKNEEEQIKKYNEFVGALSYQKYMDWDSIDPTIHKTSPIHNPPMTAICFWFYLCTQYFPKRDIKFYLKTLNKNLDNTTKNNFPLKLNQQIDNGFSQDDSLEGKNIDWFIKGLEEYGDHEEEYKKMLDGVDYEKVKSVAKMINDGLDCNQKKEKLFGEKIKGADIQNIAVSDHARDVVNAEYYGIADDLRLCFFRCLTYNIVNNGMNNKAWLDEEELVDTVQENQEVGDRCQGLFKDIDGKGDDNKYGNNISQSNLTGRREIVPENFMKEDKVAQAQSKPDPKKTLNENYKGVSQQHSTKHADRFIGDELLQKQYSDVFLLQTTEFATKLADEKSCCDKNRHVDNDCDDGSKMALEEIIDKNKIIEEISGTGYCLANEILCGNLTEESSTPNKNVFFYFLKQKIGKFEHCIRKTRKIADWA